MFDHNGREIEPRPVFTDLFRMKWVAISEAYFESPSFHDPGTLGIARSSNSVLQSRPRKIP